MAQQTAVKQLINYMKENFYLTDESLQKFEEAKELNRQQIVTAWKKGKWEHDKMAQHTPVKQLINYMVADKLAKQYYNETYTTRLQNETN